MSGEPLRNSDRRLRAASDPGRGPQGENWLMPTPSRLAVLLSTALLVAAACGGGDDPTTESAGEPAPVEADEEPAEEPAPVEAEEPGTEEGPESAGNGGATPESDSDPAENGEAPEAPIVADDSLPPVKIGLIAQDEGLLAFPEVRAVGLAFKDYFNAELGGVDGHPVELQVCGTGDSPESAVACAQEFANADDVHVVIQGTVNTAATNGTLVDVGKPVLNLGNDLPDYVTEGVHTFDPGVLGLAQVIFVFAADSLGSTEATLFHADDPLFASFVPLLEGLAASSGITITETIPLGFEPDLTGPISAADDSNDSWMFVLGDAAQCTAAARATATVGFAGNSLANDLCMAQDVVESGVIDGWFGPVVSTAPTVDGGPEVDEIVRILDTYGGPEAQTAGLAGWTLANMLIARDVLGVAGGPEATDDSVHEALGDYSSSDILGYPDVSCPGPGIFVSACNTTPLVVEVVEGAMTQPEGFVDIDFGVFEFLLGG